MVSAAARQWPLLSPIRSLTPSVFFELNLVQPGHPSHKSNKHSSPTINPSQWTIRISALAITFYMTHSRPRTRTQLCASPPYYSWVGTSGPCESCYQTV
ncbi:hypothetical protein A4X06_0g7971 [Tilletia controversa]|uniref:Uncharacterized protein n=1 Tax=Tilletia controversa TaxID=13291 RepID=A0A8X7MM03_9BASI|nr:hypothetical protein A4X06_0g7971 [Tilletia controversa]